MLLRHSFSDAAGAARIEAAVETAYARGARTADVAAGGPSLSTAQFTGVVANCL